MENIVVVGGTKGIGKNIANLLKESNLFVLARTIDEGSDVSDAHFIKADVTQPTIDLSMLPEVIDGLVYCPGSINLRPFHRLTDQDFVDDWNINFMGAVRIIRQLLPNLKKAESPSIVLFSTVAVSIGMPFHASIAAAKGSIEGLTKALAAELAPKIRVNCIAPSLTETPLSQKLVNTPEKIEGGAKRHPLQRIGQTNDIAQMACFLLSGSASWMTGQIIHVDGGMSTFESII